MKQTFVKCSYCKEKVSYFDLRIKMPYICKGCLKEYLAEKNKQRAQFKSSKSLAMERADEWFSRFIRMKYRIKGGDEVLNRCIVSGKVKFAKNMDCGHCFSRGVKSLRYDEDNCRPQNRSSNRFKGEQDHYTFKDNLKKEIGEERFNRLEEKRKWHTTYTESDYRNIADKYRKKVNKIIKEEGLKKWW